MSRFMSTLLKSKIAVMDHFAAWIDPQGTVHELQDETHSEYAQRILGVGLDVDSAELLQQKGWRQLGAFYSAGAYLSTGRPLTQRDLETFQSWLMEDPKRMDVAGGRVSLGTPGSLIELSTDEFLAINKITELRRFRVATSS